MPPLLLITHNHREPVRQKLGWSTEIEVSRMGTEKRRRLRNEPIETLTYTLTIMNQKDANVFAGMLGKLIDMQVEFPRWEDTVNLTAPVSAGGNILPITNGIIGRHFEVGRRVLLYNRKQPPEIVEVVTSADPLEVSPLVSNWKSAMVVPLELGRIESPISGPDLGNILRDPTVVMSVDEDIAGVTLDPGPVPMVAASVAIRVAYTGVTGLPYGGSATLFAEAFDTDGFQIPNPIITWSVTASSVISGYESGRLGRFILRHSGTGSDSVTVTATVDGVSTTATFSA